MCTAMGYEPEEDKIPVEFEDLYTDVQEAFVIYSRLTDRWDGFNGVYLGKDYSGILDMFKLLEVPEEDWKTVFDLLNMIDGFRIEEIRKTTERRRAKDPA